MWSHDTGVDNKTFSSLRSRGRTEKRKNGQKHHRTKAPKDKKSKRTKPKKRENIYTPTIKVYDPISVDVITLYRCGQSTFLVIQSRMLTEKSQNGQKQNRTKAPKDKNQSGQNQQKRKYFNTPTIKMYDSHFLFMWSHDTFFFFFFVTKLYCTPLLHACGSGIGTWYRCGQSTFTSCNHVGRQRKAKMDKSTLGQKAQRIKIKADKTPKREKYLNTPTIKVYDPISVHVITWYRCGNQHSRHEITWVDRQKLKWTKAP